MNSGPNSHAPAYQVCNRCVMDTSDPEITFNDNGICNHCSNFDATVSSQWFVNDNGAEKLRAIIDLIKKENTGKRYDCIAGLSGGVDSSYMVYKAVQMGLRPLVVHVDCGWNSEIAVKNIENLVVKLKLDLYTHVVDWEEMKDLQLAFFKSGVANQDIPQDHAIFAALYRYAVKNNISWVLNGSNFASESVLPRAWGYNALDFKHIRAVQKRFGTLKLKKYPHVSFFRRYVYFSYIRKMRILKMLNYIPYHRDEAIAEMEREIGWRYYGGKHHESRFTKFFQTYYLPVKFGFDKRKAHYSSLILSGQMPRDEALHKLQSLPYDEKEIENDIDYVASKLAVAPAEFRKIIAGPNKLYSDYPSNEWIFRMGFKLRDAVFGKK